MVDTSKKALFTALVTAVLITCFLLINFSTFNTRTLMVAIDKVQVHIRRQTVCDNNTWCHTGNKSTNSAREQGQAVVNGSIPGEDVENVTSGNSTRCMQKVMLNVTRTLLDSHKVTPHSVHTDPSRNLTIYGRIQGGGRYGVYGSTIGNPVALKYLFVLPLTALAWTRIGFGSVVILLADSGPSCHKEALITYMVAKLLSRNATVILMESDPRNTVMLSQTSRIFAASLLSERVADNSEKWPETFFITSDSDIWPLRPSPYTLASGNSILTLHGGCCGSFHHKNKRYRMLPMANIGMNQSVWTSVLSRYNTGPPHSPGDILQYFIREFGQIVTQPVTKGGNFGWYLDQKMSSIVVWDWIRNHTARKDMGTRPGLNGRIGHNHWDTSTLGTKIDVHLLSWAYKPKSWNRILPLLKLMYDEETVKWCYDYMMFFRVHFSGDKTYRIPTSQV